MKQLKITVFLLISSALAFYPFIQAKAVPTGDISTAALLYKETVIDPAARLIANEILKSVTNKIVGNIATAGRDGGPAFVQNWRNFQLQGQYRGEDIWRGILDIAVNGESSLGISPLICDYIRQSAAFNSFQPVKVPNLIQSGLNRRVDSLQEYLVSARCDPIINQNYSVFIQDFEAGGGWDTFQRLLQPQNNIYGAIGLALDELERQRSIEESADLQEAVSAFGFLGKRPLCISRGISGECAVWDNIVTPGDVLGKTVTEAVNQSLAWVTNADELDEILSHIISSLVDRVFSDIGLAGGQDLDDSNYQVPKQTIPPISQPPIINPDCQLIKIPGTEDYDIVCDIPPQNPGGFNPGGPFNPTP